MISVALIGLGNIGFEYDLNYDQSEYCLTHYNALKNSKDFKLEFLVDLDNKAKIYKYKQRFNEDIEIYNTIETIPKSVDMLVFAISPNFVLEALTKYLKKFECKYVIGEKLGMMSKENLTKVKLLISKKKYKCFL